MAAPAPLLAAASRPRAALLSNSAAAGLGRYRLSKLGDDHTRVSRAFEYAADHLTWTDGRELRCQAKRDHGTCESAFEILSNAHLADEIARLEGYNGILEGPACRACGQRYLEAPHEFGFNGANSKRAPRKGAGTAGAKGIRLVHRPCRGKKGARFTVSPRKARYDLSAYLKTEYKTTAYAKPRAAHFTTKSHTGSRRSKIVCADSKSY
jgi:hypothetical protein